MAALDPYALIQATARATRRRRQEELLVAAAPPLLALLAAAGLGRLPVELGVAGAIAAVFLAFFARTIDVGRVAAASFLDRSLSAKDHFLTLATIEATAPLRSIVESHAAAIVAREGVPPLPPRKTRPVWVSSALSLLLLAVLWLLPALAPLVTPADPLERIAAVLGESANPLDREIATQLRIVNGALKDRSLPNREKLARIQEAMQKIEKAEQKQGSGSSASGGSGGKSEQAGENQTGGEQQGGQDKGGNGKTEAHEGGSGNSEARDAAKQQLSKAAGELQGEQQKGDQAKGGNSKQGAEKKPNPAGGGIQGPESDADERKPGEKESTGDRPGTRPDKPGGDQQQGGEQGESKSEQGKTPQSGTSQAPGAGPGAAASGEGASNRPSKAPDGKPAERFYKPGEGPGGGVVDGRYVTIRVPEDRQRLPGTEPVAKPGDVELEVGYGNAPLPSAGSPGEVSADQPVPLEYRAALGGGSK